MCTAACLTAVGTGAVAAPTVTVAVPLVVKTATPTPMARRSFRPSSKKKRHKPKATPTATVTPARATPTWTPTATPTRPSWPRRRSRRSCRASPWPAVRRVRADGRQAQADADPGADARGDTDARASRGHAAARRDAGPDAHRLVSSGRDVSSPWPPCASTRPPSTPPSTGTGASCTSTATGCSAPSTRPRTRCRTRSCARGRRARASRAVTACARGCTRSPPTCAWTRCARSKRRPPTQGEIPWLQPYPDRLLDEVAPTEEEPDAVVVARETIELTYIAVIQLLPARQRAVLVLRDVLEWSAAETAEMLDLSVAVGQQRAAARPGDAERAAAAARRRARRAQRGRAAAAAGLHRHARERRLGGRRGADARGHPRVDAAASRRCYNGREAMRAARSRRRRRWASGGSCPRARTACRARPPTCAGRARRCSARSSSTCCAASDGQIAEIMTFGSKLFGAFGLPDELADVARS